jgi:hypothetical protein
MHFINEMDNKKNTIDGYAPCLVLFGEQDSRAAGPLFITAISHEKESYES